MEIRDHYNRRLQALKNERESFIPHYKELSEFVRPRRGRFFVEDRNKGDKRYQSIINSRATRAHKICTAGMIAGTMSPARPWFSLETIDPDLMENRGVKDWLFSVEQRIRSVLNESNFYSMAPIMMGEMVLFGTGCMSHVEDFNDVARFYTHTAGSYMISQNEKMEVDTLYREFEWSVKQIVDAFGIENCSTPVKNAYDRGNYDLWYPVCHAVEPNTLAVSGSKLSKDKSFRSVYFEPGNVGPDRNKLLSSSGFNEFPVYVPRWEVTGEDIYGTDCPAMTALGDIKGLQVQERTKAQALQIVVRPPMGGPASLRGVPVNQLPGGLTVYDGDEQRQKLGPLYQINPGFQDLRFDMDAIERRIDEVFYVDMFMAISNMEGIQPRNELDIMQRNEERLLQLGPVLERIQGEFLSNLVDRVFNQCYRAGILPPPPDALSGEPLKVKYISTLAMAQRAVATQGIERVLSFAGNLVKLGFTDAMNKIDAPQAVDEYAKAIGVPPTIIRSDDEVEQIAAQQAQQRQAQEAIIAAQGAADVAKTVSETKLDGDNLLSRSPRR